MSGFSRGKLEAGRNELGLCTARYMSLKLLLVCFEGLARLSRRVWRRFVRGSREISLVPSLHRASTDALIYKWKNHFYEMKGDVGMSVHEKERKQEDAYIHHDTNSFITPSLHLCSEFCLFVVNALGKEKTSSH